MTLLIRGKIAPETKNPLNRFLISIYEPTLNFVLRFRGLVLFGALALLVLTIFPFARLGKEFMPPLNEGTLLYMPTAVPGMSITEATKILQIQDRQLKKLPEVTTVFGKAGQAETATDPAPLSMFETIISLKPFDQWPRGMTWDKFLGELNMNLRTPGMANIFWMPIQTRTEMLTTGFRSALGIKVFGPDLQGIENLAVQIETAIVDLPDTRSVFAERTVGGYFLDFDVNREAAARYGLTAGDVNDVVETAIGGKTITTTVEARERYPVRARYAPDFRQDLDSLKRVLIPTPTGAQIPISLVADIRYRTGPPSIRNENGQLVGFVLIDPATSNIDGYVRHAAKRIAERVKFPAGYHIEWAGQFQYIKQAEQRLKIVVPLTLLIIFVLIYFNTRSVDKNEYRATGCSIFFNRRVLVAVVARLSHERCGLGRFACARRTRCRDRCRDVALFGSRVGKISIRRANEIDCRSSCRNPRRSGAAFASEGDDGVRNRVWFAADHVVANHSNRRRRHEAYRHANDWRGSYFDASGVAYLPDNFLHVARTENR